MSKSPKLRLHVDQDKCQGHAQDKAWLAQTNCPEIAIEVTEE